MNAEQSSAWIEEVVGEVFQAVVGHGPLREALVFKGARILNLHIEAHRRSLDIDSNLTSELQCAHADLDAMRGWFEEELGRALRRYFERQEPVRFTLKDVRVARRPRRPHPYEWNSLEVKIRVEDATRRDVRNLPRIEIDIAAPEELGPGAVVQLSLDGCELKGYSLFRIAGEKLRAFLTSLPAYREKITSPTREHRVKDLHDLARILENRPLEDAEFWEKAANEFRLACKSRHVDCAGLGTFREGWTVTESAYRTNANLDSIPFPQADEALARIVAAFDEMGVFPLTHPLPPMEGNGEE